MELFLPFERPIEQVEQQVRRQAWRVRQGEADASDQLIEALERRARLRRQVYGRLGPWERVQLARHPQRPHGLRAAQVAFGELEPLRGDRTRADDGAIIAGIGRMTGRPVVVIACDRGDDKREAHRRNFGMPGPEGFRKAIRVLEFAERRQMPVVSFVDTPGAWPGVDSERYAVAE
ncbi:MAG: acetyl-CoA carboxylase carboxyl transferase subunit alpha, partial [Candidatus Dadabacteria bacterium]